HFLIHIAKRNHFDGCDLQEPEKVTFAVPPAADESNPFFLIGELVSKAAQSRKGQGRSGGLKEGSAAPAGRRRPPRYGTGQTVWEPLLAGHGGGFRSNSAQRQGPSPEILPI